MSGAAAPPATAAVAVAELLGRCRIERLANGLEVCLATNRQAPLVATSLWYGAGTRHESPGLEGTAHFLEHMMFKGSRRFAAGEIDRLTQSLGGSNNAFTSHDASCYYFSFARDHWTRALDIEADRMTALTLDPDEVERERQVVLEEIAMYEDDPWDALEHAAYRAVYGDHPYARPVLGERSSLARVGAAELDDFHRRFYRPANAVLVLAGDLPDDALARVESRFAAIAGSAAEPFAPPMPLAAGFGEALDRRDPHRIERRHGSRSRLLVALPAPTGDAPDFAPLWLAVTLLAGGRASRLHRALVEDGRLCASVSAEITEMVGPGLCLIAAEPLAGIAGERVEEALHGELECLRAGVEERELERARRLMLADWVFSIERIHQQALLVGGALARFSLAATTDFLRRLEAATAGDVVRAARRYLVVGRPAVIAWSLPA